MSYVNLIPCVDPSPPAFKPSQSFSQIVKKRHGTLDIIAWYINIALQRTKITNARYDEEFRKDARRRF